MKKSDIKELVSNATTEKRLCRINFEYDENAWFVFPLIVGEKLLLCANEDEFILNGYSIRRFKDVKKAEYQEGKIFSMIKAEGITGNLIIPEIDVTDWNSVFSSLQSLKINIIVENEKAAEDECSLIIGRIVKVTKTKVVMQHFDADGIWEDELFEVPFTKITSVSFGTRYVEIFSKYLSCGEFV